MALQTGMKVYQMGERLVETTVEEALRQTEHSLFLCTSRVLKHVLNLTRMNFEGEISLRDVAFNKIESQQECLWGTLFIPNLVDVMGSRYRILFFINREYIIIVDDYEFSQRVIGRIRSRRIHQADSRVKFLCNFLTEIINRDQITLANYEKKLL